MQSTPSADPVGRLLDRFLSERALGSEQSIEEFARAVPEHRTELLQAWGEWMRGRAALAQLSVDVGAPRLAVGFEAGLQLGDYVLCRRLGSGGQGVVWEAEQLSLGRRVALKLYAPDRLDARALLRLQREARAAGRISHPGIVRVHAFGESEGVHWIAQELVPTARTLRHWIEERRGAPLPRAAHELFAADCVLRVCEALQAAHEQDVLHRDVKPSNVLLAEQDRPLLTDFGLAWLADEDSLSATGDLVGTIAYMSPEQLHGARERVDERSDVWGAGVLLYELLHLQRPFRGETSSELTRSIQLEEPDSFERGGLRTSRELELICRKALEKDPAQRYPSAGELARDLRRHLDHEPIAARRSPLAARMRKWVRRNRVASAVLFVGAVALAALSVLYVQLLIGRETLAREHGFVMRIVELHELESLRSQVDELWPATPEKEPELRAWVERADALVAGLEGFESSEDPRGHGAALEALRAQIDAAEQPDPVAVEWASQLDQLVSELTRFADPERGPLDGESATHGRGVRWRLENAQRVRSLWNEHRPRWTEAAAAVASEPRYAGLVLRPQSDLIPLGADPDSGLWEFAHLPSGALPARDGAGALILDEESCVVLVLIPGGSAIVGASEVGEEREHPDPYLLSLEGSPPHRVELEPYFLAKHELTQAQWVRFAADNPSRWKAEEIWQWEPVLWTHPVGRVTWLEATRWLERMALCLPTEAQWEHAARGATTTPWWTGEHPQSLADAENLLDRKASSRIFGRAEWTDANDRAKTPEPWMDEHAAYAPVGSYRANPFGLYDVHGNVREWCADSWTSYSDFDPRPGDGLRQAEPGSMEAGRRVLRGGSFLSPASYSRSAFRGHDLLDFRHDHHGIRPARALER